ncbi:MAG: cyclic nucleotide-binding domain-containing protein [Kofleriaceae bacterium]
MRRLLTLRQFPGFADAELSDLANIADNGFEATYAPGDVVAEPGHVEAIHLVVEGSLAGGTRSWHANQMFGLFEVLAGRPIAHRVIATSRTRVLSLASSDFAEVLEDSYSVLHSARKALARRLLYIERTSGELPPSSAPPSLADLPQHKLGMVERLIILRQQMQFASGRAQALAAIAQASEERRFPAHVTIAEAGEEAAGGVIVLTGLVRATRPDGNSIVYGPGDNFGGLSTMASLPLDRSFETMTPVRSLFTPARVIMDIMEDHTDYALGLLSRLAARLLDHEAEPPPMPLPCDTAN